VVEPRLRAQLEQRQAQLLVAEAVPAADAGVAVTREGTGNWLLLFRFGVPLGFGNPAQYNAGNVERSADGLLFEAKHRVERLTKQTQQLERELRATQELLRTVNEEERRSAEEAYRIVSLQQGVGKISLSLALSTQRSVSDAERHANLVQHRIRLIQARLAWLNGSLASWIRNTR
jgi:hypothetical protein